MNVPSPTTVHIAREEDIPSLALLAKEWLDEIHQPLDLSEIEEELLRRISNGSIIFAAKDARPVGFISCYALDKIWEKKKTAHEHYLFVRRKERGTGVSDILLASYAAWAKANGCSKIIVCPNSSGGSDPKRVAAYLGKRGFSIYGYQMMREI